MEFSGQQQDGVFRRSSKFEINDRQFSSIEIKNQRIRATGHKTNTQFDLLISFIGGVWKERWRRFGMSVLIAGIILTFFGIIVTIPYLRYLPLMMFGMMFLAPELALIALWYFLKREALMLYTPGGNFKIEGTEGFIEDIWNVIMRVQVERLM